MNIAIDVSPLKIGHFLQHRVRGTGFYIENLKKSLQKYYPDNKYIFFTRGEKLPKDLNLVHYPYFEPFFPTLLFAKKNKFVVTVHDLTPLVFPKNFPPGIKGKIKWFFQKANLRKASIIITDSNASKKDIVRFAGIEEGKVRVVYLAAGEHFGVIKDAREIQTLKNKYKLPNKFALYVGDVTWNKNLPRMIEAVIQAEIPLVLVGKALSEQKYDVGNPWNQDLVKVKNMISNKKNIYVLGFVENDDLIRLYNAATVFVMPSLYEGFGLPILEAMSCGCPVVASKEGSIPEIAGEAALYVDAYDINNIGWGIKKVFKDNNLQKSLSKKGIMQTRKFSWKKTAGETVAVYREAVS